MMAETAAAKPSLRAAQRDVTRRRIRDSARKLFGSGPFEQVSMEDIARDAEVGRTTIYLHYPTKNALLVELLQEDWDRRIAFFERLTGTAQVDLKVLRSWVEGYAKGMREARSLFRMYLFTLSLDDEVGRLQHLHRETLIRILGRRLPGLVTREEARPDQRRAAAASHALIAHLEYYGGVVGGDASREDVEAATDVLVEDLARFMGT
jgi:AcrR family transcriptional regulator